MLRGPMQVLWVGFGIACAGFVALNYISYRMRQQGFKRNAGRRLSSRNWEMIRQCVGWWPFVVAGVCIPAGILMAFSAIIYNNHLRLR
jgi:hypothetical protein